MRTPQISTLKLFNNYSQQDKSQFIFNSFNFSTEAVINVLRGTVSGVQRSENEKIKPQISRLFLKDISLSERRAILSSKNSVALWEVFYTKVESFSTS